MIPPPGPPPVSVLAPFGRDGLNPVPMMATLEAPEDHAEPEEETSSPLLRAVQIDGISEYIALFLDPPSIAQLCACCTSLHSRFGAPALWERLLEQQFSVGELTDDEGPRVAYARHEVIQRWGLHKARGVPLTTPTTLSSGRRGNMCRAMHMHTSSAGSMQSTNTCPSPISSKCLTQRNKENASPNTSFSRMTAVRRRRTTSSPAHVNEAMLAFNTRLKQDLFHMMTSNHSDAFGAFPDTPGDFTSWSGFITCSAAGSLHEGIRFQVKLKYDLDSRGNTTIPMIRFIQPYCFHPNVRPDGTICARALEKRVVAVDAVSTILSRVSDLLSRPCFAVAPVNKLAAALWYGDRGVLRRHRPHPQLVDDTN